MYCVICEDMGGNGSSFVIKGFSSKESAQDYIDKNDSGDYMLVWDIIPEDQLNYDNLPISISDIFFAVYDN